MTPLERELILEKVQDWVISVLSIQDEVGDGKDNQIQDLKIDIMEFKETLKGLDK